jgi:hypothetical protein
MWYGEGTQNKKIMEINNQQFKKVLEARSRKAGRVLYFLTLRLPEPFCVFGEPHYG